MTKIKELNGFTYVTTTLPHLKTTLVYFEGLLYEVRKEFVCLECLKDVELVYKAGVTTSQQAKTADRCNYESLCQKCLPVTDEQINGAAVALREILCH